MCTVSVLPLPDGYRLWMNRDERMERRDDGALWPHGDALWPVDPMAGGTWLGAHASGWTLALLNQYPPAAAARGVSSRGGLIPKALAGGDPAGALDRLLADGLRDYAPFLLLAFGPQGPWQGLRWDGDGARRKNWPRSLRSWSSSSVGGWPVLRARRRPVARLARLGGTVDAQARALDALHTAHGPGGFCVHRETSGTVAHERVVVDRAGLRIVHHSGAPCQEGPTSEGR